MLVILSLSLSMAACESTPQGFREVSVNEQFSLKIPESMDPSTELHDFAELQYADEENGYYMIGIQEPKAALTSIHLYYDLPEYAWFVQRKLTAGLDTARVSEPIEQEFNGLRCVSADIFGALTQGKTPVELYYRITVYESASHYYQLIGWTFRERCEPFREIFREVECSFRELPQDQLPSQDSTSTEAEPALTALP